MKLSEFVKHDAVSGPRLLSAAKMLPEFKDKDPENILDQDAMGIIEKLEEAKLAGTEETVRELRERLSSIDSE